MSLVVQGTRLYRFTPEERLVAEQLKRPAGIVYEKRYMCGFYPVDGIGALNADLLTQDPPIADDLKSTLRAAYYDSAGAPLLGSWTYLCGEFDVAVAVPATEPEPAVVALANAPGWDAGAISQREFFDSGRVRFRAGPGFRAILGIQAGGDSLDVNAPAFNMYCNEHSIYCFARGVPGAPADIFGLFLEGGSHRFSNESSVLTIEKIGRRVQFKIDNGGGEYVAYTYTVPASIPTTVYGLGAAVFTPSGWVEGVDVVGYSGAELTLPGLAVRGGAAPAQSGGNLALAGLVVAGGRTTGGALSLPSLAVRGGRELAEGYLALDGIYVQGGDFAALGVTSGVSQLPGIRVGGYSRVGTVGRADIRTRALAVRGGQGTAADAFAVLDLPGVAIYGGSGLADEARMFSHSGGDFVLTSYYELAVVMTTNGAIAAVLGTGLVKDTAMESGAGAAASMGTTSVLAAAIDELVAVGTGEPLREQIGEVWVTSLMDPKNPATSTFEGYPFNSFGVIGGRPFGVSRDGVYLLEGDDDDGAPIRASVSYGKQDFGTKTEKLMTRAYVGASSDGTMYLKITANGQEYVYSARGASMQLQQQRFDVGRGLKANYFTFELFNKDGGDFEIDSVSFFAADFKRRI